MKKYPSYLIIFSVFLSYGIDAYSQIINTQNIGAAVGSCEGVTRSAMQRGDLKITPTQAQELNSFFQDMYRDLYRKGFSSDLNRAAGMAMAMGARSPATEVNHAINQCLVLTK